MLSKFEKEYLKFIRDDAAQDKVVSALIGFTKSKDAAKEFIYEIGEFLLIKNAKEKPIMINENFVGFFITVAKRKWIDKYRKEKNNNLKEAKGIYHDLFAKTIIHPEDIEDLEQKSIIQINQDFILENIEQYIPDDFKRRIFLARNDLKAKKQIQYKEIASQFKNDRITQPNGSPCTPGYLRKAYHDIHKNLIDFINDKHPNFSTELITNNNG